jgi:UDPglucose 6-dehydrogenase
VRDSPALEIVSDLLFSQASIVAFDPAAMVRAEGALPKLPNLSFAGSAYEACEGADALLVLTEWEEFYDLDLLRIKKLLRLPILLDGKNVFNPLHARAAGLNYYGIGSMAERPRKLLAQESIPSC